MDQQQTPTDSSRSVLVTGATGFIGMHLCNLLLDADSEVRALIRPQSNNRTTIASLRKIGESNLTLIEGEIKDTGFASEVCSGMDTVFHLAGIAHAGNLTATHLNEVNVEYTKVLAEACVRAGVRRLVFFSSLLAAKAERSERSGETLNAYAKSKRDAETGLLDADLGDLEISILRPANVYGPQMKGNIAAMIRRIRSGRLPPLPRLDHSLSLVGVNDLCKAAILAANSDAAAGQIYTVTDGVSYTPNTIEEAIYEALGRKKPGWRSPRMVFYAASLGAQMANSMGIWKNDLGLRTYRNLIGNRGLPEASCEKITTELGYQPTETFYQSLPAILEHLD